MNHEMQGSWTHSSEEDEGDILVYRPTESYAFPPARRGRDTLVFSQGGQVSNYMPGPDDRPREVSGSWQPLGMGRYKLEGAGGNARVIEVVEHTPDVLKIRNL
jgi:hypothetical protein